MCFSLLNDVVIVHDDKKTNNTDAGDAPSLSFFLYAFVYVLYCKVHGAGLLDHAHLLQGQRPQTENILKSKVLSGVTFPVGLIIN